MRFSVFVLLNQIDIAAVKMALKNDTAMFETKEA
jgi:hypothetical protein